MRLRARRSATVVPRSSPPNTGMPLAVARDTGAGTVPFGVVARRRAQPLPGTSERCPAPELCRSESAGPVLSRDDRHGARLQRRRGSGRTHSSAGARGCRSRSGNRPCSALRRCRRRCASRSPERRPMPAPAVPARTADGRRAPRVSPITDPPSAEITGTGEVSQAAASGRLHRPRIRRRTTPTKRSSGKYPICFESRLCW